jgi:hypothetical protein
MVGSMRVAAWLSAPIGMNSGDSLLGENDRGNVVLRGGDEEEVGRRRNSVAPGKWWRRRRPARRRCGGVAPKQSLRLRWPVGTVRGFKNSDWATGATGPRVQWEAGVG